MFIHNFNPILFKFGFFELRWYSLAYIFGILIGWWIGKKIFNFKKKNKNIDIKTDLFDDLVSYIIVSIIVGGRLGYVLFYNPLYYLDNPLEIIKIWEGGMSFHGALIGIIIGTFFFSKKVKINTFFFLDIIAVVSPIGLFFGRIANFINGELYGKPSEIFWSVIFPSVDNLPRHPSQLYEALTEGLLLFLILITLIYKKEIKLGICSSVFLIFYGLFRIFCEQFREPDIQIGYLFNYVSMGSALSLVMVIVGIIIFKIHLKKNEIFE